VVGSKNSSNSQRLREIAEASGTVAHLIDDVSELRDEWFEGVETVLVTAGASAPEFLLKEIILHLMNNYDGEVEQRDLYHESVEFGLPGTLKRFMRSQGIDPTGRRIKMDNAAASDSWLSELNIKHRTVDLTVSAVQ
jgi:4-hydroxy-3-methylbut-2-enyl diphosphate reductase